MSLTTTQALGLVHHDEPTLVLDARAKYHLVGAVRAGARSGDDERVTPTSQARSQVARRQDYGWDVRLDPHLQQRIL